MGTFPLWIAEELFRGGGFVDVPNRDGAAASNF